MPCWWFLCWLLNCIFLSLRLRSVNGNVDDYLSFLKDFPSFSSSNCRKYLEIKQTCILFLNISSYSLFIRFGSVSLCIHKKVKQRNRLNIDQSRFVSNSGSFLWRRLSNGFFPPSFYIKLLVIYSNEISTLSCHLKSYVYNNNITTSTKKFSVYKIVWLK